MQSYKIALIMLVIAVLLSFYAAYKESFVGSPDALKCGVDQPPCPMGQMCINGYCNLPNTIPLPVDTGLPVLP